MAVCTRLARGVQSMAAWRRARRWGPGALAAPCMRLSSAHPPGDDSPGSQCNNGGRRAAGRGSDAAGCSRGAAGRRMQSDARARRHGDARARVAVQAAADDVSKRRVAQRRHVDRVRRVGDCMHLLDEGQRREGRVAGHHLVQDAAQAPHVGRPAHLAGRAGRRGCVSCGPGLGHCEQAHWRRAAAAPGFRVRRAAPHRPPHACTRRLGGAAVSGPRGSLQPRRPLLHAALIMNLILQRFRSL